MHRNWSGLTDIFRGPGAAHPLRDEEQKHPEAKAREKHNLKQQVRLVYATYDGFFLVTVKLEVLPFGNR